MANLLKTIINEDGFLEARLEPTYPDRRIFKEDLLNEAIAKFCEEKQVPTFEVSGGDRFYIGSLPNAKDLLIELSQKLLEVGFIQKDDGSEEPLPLAIAACTWDPYIKEMRVVSTKTSVLRRQELMKELDSVERESDRYLELLEQLAFEMGEPDDKIYETEQEVTVGGLAEFWRSGG